MDAKLQVMSPFRKSVGARLTLAVLACVLALSTLVSTLAIVELHDHDCTGDACPICLVLEASQAVLSLAATGLSFSAFVLAFAMAFAVALAACGVLLAADNPVSLKVRLVI